MLKRQILSCAENVSMSQFSEAGKNEQTQVFLQKLFLNCTFFVNIISLIKIFLKPMNFHKSSLVKHSSSFVMMK